MEYTQVSGSGGHPKKDDDIVCSLWKHKVELKAQI